MSFKKFFEIYIPENQGKNFTVICPNDKCHSEKMIGSTIFLWCQECLWAGHIQECLFKQKEEEKDAYSKNEAEE